MNSTDSNKTQLKIIEYRDSYEEELIRLWERCSLIMPQNNPLADIRSKLDFQPNLIYIGILENKLIASVMVGYEGHRGWINYLAVEPEYQKKGIGRSMMTFTEKILKELGCPKINIQVRDTNKNAIDFYKKTGFSVDNVTSLGKRLC